MCFVPWNADPVIGPSTSRLVSVPTPCNSTKAPIPAVIVLVAEADILDPAEDVT